MGNLMGKQGVLDLAKKLMDKNREVMKQPENYLAHLGDSYEIAREVVMKSISIYPRLKTIY